MGKILVVDDEESIRLTFKVFLSDEGHSVETAKDYFEGLALISRNDFDLIFLDLSLGGKNGMDLLREVKERNLSAFVVIITGRDIDRATEAIRLGAFRYLTKPVRQELLLEVTNLALKQKANQPE